MTHAGSGAQAQGLCAQLPHSLEAVRLLSGRSQGLISPDAVILRNFSCLEPMSMSLRTVDQVKGHTAAEATAQAPISAPGGPPVALRSETRPRLAGQSKAAWPWGEYGMLLYLIRN